jgi:cell division protein FtsQ
MPWVSGIFVRRYWPDRIEITIIEKNAVARWNEQGLLSDKGEIFSPHQTTYPDKLPMFSGPDGKQITMLQTFIEMNRLFAPLHARITQLELSPYLSWKLMLDNGMILRIGHKDVLTRVDHFVKVYPKVIGDRIMDVEYVDLRYPNGMAVRWRTPILNQ